MITNNIVMWEILLSKADWDFLKTLTLREILKIQNPLQEEHYVYLAVIHLFQEVGSVRNKHQFLTVQQNVRGVSWSEVATVPKRKSRRSLDLSLSWNSEEDIWKGRKKSNGTKRKRRRVKRTTTTQRTGAHAWMG